MERIEEIKKILMAGEITIGSTVETARTGQMFVFDAKRLARQINQLYEPHDYNRGFKDGQDVLKESGDRDKEPQPNHK